jgi:chromosome segregation ATPase
MELYGDLLDSGLQEEIQRLKQELVASRKSEQALKADVVDMKKQIDSLLDDKNILEHNITLLFNTATLESSRKTKEIAELRMEVIELRDKNRNLLSKLDELSIEQDNDTKKRRRY